ncbi:nucleotidyl transferase AbiEii/AbiGii toxin family protein [Bradyrhizobium oligotrophicum]|uniref:nucleotidyl transferase AbiEii/AbiGii toxin family protein n=1 Tax=Bradyrhizobium TaxID=374 RepID=UPI003EBFA4A6
MNPGFVTFLSAAAEDRRDAFLGAAQRLGAPEQNIEKDFWVCWTLDALFNGAEAGGPRLLFKGGTSLSKAFGLISRFSEDIDITIFRDDLGEGATVDELEALSGKKRRRRLDAIKGASQAYVNETMRQQVEGHLRETLETAGLEPEAGRVELDPDDSDRQSLLIWYPKVTAADEGYVRPAVKIESGAKSALDPNKPVIVKPYVADVLADFELNVPDVRTVVPERTFWDKIVILHGLRQWFDARGALRGGGQRISRHYYDVYRLLDSDVGLTASSDLALGVDCVRHARMFFNSPDLNLATAVPGSFTLSPNRDMATELTRDYAAMAGMIFGEAPALEEVLGRVAELEARINQAETKSAAASRDGTGGAGA